MQDKRNYEINLFKFLFSMVVLLFHGNDLIPVEVRESGFGLFMNGSIAVEFFFIVSGYFFAVSCLGGGV